MFDQNTLAQLHANYLATKPAPVQQAKPKKKGNFLTSLIPSGGGTAGGAAGAAIGSAILPGVGTLAGALLGGALGGGAGKIAENAVEHQSIGSGVAGEAALNGVLGAGPLRLGKLGIDAVRGVRAGAGLADALKGAGTAATDFSLTKAAGDKLANSGQGLIAKEFRLNPTQQANFSKLHGEEATSVLRRYGVKSPEDIQNKIQPLQDAFDNVITKIPDVSQQNLSTGLKKVYEPLLKSPALFEQGLGQQVKQQADELVKLAQSGSIPASKVNDLRKTFDAAVSYTQKGAPEYNVIKKTADALRGTLQGAADKAGVKTADGLSFKDAGRELRKLYGLDEIIGKQQYLGTGSLPANLPNLLGVIGGGVAGGGPFGAAGGLAATTLFNSNAGRRALANGAIKTGEKIAGRESAPFSVKSVASRIAPVGLAGALAETAQSRLPNNSPNTTAAPTTTNPMTNADISDTLSQTDSNLSSPFSASNIEANLQKLAQAGASDKQIESYLSLASTLQSIHATDAKANAPQPGFSKPSAAQYGQALTGLQSVQQLADLVSSNPDIISKNAVPGQGLGVAGGLLSGALGTSQYRAITNNILNSIARINTGANMPESERQFYEKSYLPQPGDSDAAKAQKVQTLVQFFQPLVSYQGNGGGDLASALGL